ncbi:hypothetical protein EMPS_07302 [Entomortierella parvispora]|uniref:F-box domain-containing protein n=1 Tax=Entomortierella parvispora TaxID=205924 RepID=A0A9P3HDY4_9FUNG|nr:hypothetical protein EMPS_07302 [Entomortierella parvispora]
MPTAIALVSARDPYREETSDIATVAFASSQTLSPSSSSAHATASDIASAPAATAAASSSANHSTPMSAQKQQQLSFIQQQQYLQQHQQRQVVFAMRQRQQYQSHHPSSVKQSQNHSIGPLQPCPDQKQYRYQQPQHPHDQQMDQKHRQQPHKLQAPAEVNGPKSSAAPAASLVGPIKEETAVTQGLHVPCRSETNQQTVDLVDDVWRMIFYMLASSCRDLGRTMQVSRRFHNLIANDATLWKLTYKLTVSGSIFSCQKNMNSCSASSKVTEPVSPNQRPINKGVLTDLSEECSPSRNNPPSSPADRNTGAGSSHTERSQQWTPKRENNNNAEESSASSWKDSLEGPSTSSSPSARRHSAPQQPSPLTPQPQLHPTPTRSNSVGDIYDQWMGGIGLSPALQIPSALVLPHHRRMAQAALSNNSSNSPNIQPIADRGLDISALPDSSGLQPQSQTQTQRHQGAGSGQTPASTPVTSSAPSFQATHPTMVSPVHSNSTIPLSSIVYPHHIPTTTLMHHPPAVYWKYQVVEWLEQEKLRCLRLGLFWGFNADSSRSHSRKTRRNPAPPLG